MSIYNKSMNIKSGILELGDVAWKLVVNDAHLHETNVHVHFNTDDKICDQQLGIDRLVFNLNRVYDKGYSDACEVYKSEMNKYKSEIIKYRWHDMKFHLLEAASSIVLTNTIPNDWFDFTYDEQDEYIRKYVHPIYESMDIREIINHMIDCCKSIQHGIDSAPRTFTGGDYE